MTVEFLFWQPSESSISGHIALRIKNKLFSFWPVIVPIDDKHGAVPAFINRDEALETFSVGLSRLTHALLKNKNLGLPAGIAGAKIIFEHFNDIAAINSNDALRDLFSEVDKNGSLLNDSREKAIDAYVAMACFVKESGYSKEVIMQQGRPTKIYNVSFLDEAEIEACISKFQALDKNLLWYSKVGEKTDAFLNTGKTLSLPKTLFEMAGLHRYEPKKIRHNCASIILHALKSGGLDKYLEEFDETKQGLNEMIRGFVERTASAKNETLNQQHLKNSKNMSLLSNSLYLFRYGKNAINDWFGTMPEMVHKMVQTAIKQRATPSQQIKSCSMM